VLAPESGTPDQTFLNRCGFCCILNKIPRRGMTMPRDKHEPEGRQVELERQNEELRRAQGEISALHREYEELYEFTPCGNLTLDPGGIITRCNLTGLRLLGVEKNRLNGLEFSEFVAKEYRDDYFAALKGAGQSGEKISIPLRLIREDNGPSWAAADIRADLSEAGEVSRWRLALVDITERRRVEEALRESEERYRYVSESISDFAFSCVNAPGGTFVIDWLVGAVEDITGYSIEEVRNRGCWKFIVYPLDMPIFEKEVLGLSPGQTSYCELRILGRDGSTRWIGVSTSATVESGNFFSHRLFGGCKDITERKQAEVALRDNELRLRTILQTVNEGFWLIDNNTVTMDLNPRMCAILGRNREEVLGRKILDFVDSENRVVFEQQVKLRTQGEVGSYEIALSRPDGANVFCQFNATPLFDASGNRGGSFAMVTDITERKRAQQEANIQRETLARVFDSAPYIMMLVNKEGRVTNINRKGVAFAGRTKEDLLGLLGGEVFNCLNSFEGPGCGRSAECANCPVRTRVMHTFETGQNIFDGEGRLTQRYGSTDLAFDILVSTTLVKDTVDDQVLVTIIDITDRKRGEEQRIKLEEQLFQAQKMESVGRLAGGVAHDFNNMLGVILGHAEMGMDQIDSTQPLYFDLQQIHQAGLRSADLVRQLLAFARKQTVSPRILNLNETISNMIRMLKRLIGEDIELIWRPGHALWDVKIDPSQIDQILANLAVNARDAMPGAGRVIIETANVILYDAILNSRRDCAPGEYVSITFSDDGIGMSGEILGKIFEPFFTTKEVGKGTGLGLATLYGIVKQNRGCVDVFSEPDKGTTFKMFIPRFEREEENNKIDLSVDKPPMGTGTVLLVEDEEAVRNLGERILETLGYTVLSAGTPGEAISLVKEQPGDILLLITDVIMPVINGRELAERLTALKPGLKCLFMSGYPADVVAHSGVLDEGLHFIQKPFSIRALAEKIRDILE
jgi:PAS domain S-box-containing protein